MGCREIQSKYIEKRPVLPSGRPFFMRDRRDAAPPDGLSLFLRLENGAESGKSGSPAGKPAIFCVKS